MVRSEWVGGRRDDGVRKGGDGELTLNRGRRAPSGAGPSDSPLWVHELVRRQTPVKIILVDTTLTASRNLSVDVLEPTRPNRR